VPMGLPSISASSQCREEYTRAGFLGSTVGSRQCPRESRDCLAHLAKANMFLTFSVYWPFIVVEAWHKLGTSTCSLDSKRSVVN
jgi:hypothetical protein